MRCRHFEYLPQANADTLFDDRVTGYCNCPLPVGLPAWVYDRIQDVNERVDCAGCACHA